jgi:hypothetical protein
VTSTVRRRDLPPRKTLSIRARHAAAVRARYPQPVPRAASPVLDQLAPNLDPRPFLSEVREALDANVLHYSDRVTLLRSAQRQGIGRFEANLLIAIIQHRSPPTPTNSAVTLPRRISHRKLTLMAAAIAVILAGEYCLLHLALHALLGA